MPNCTVMKQIIKGPIILFSRIYKNMEIVSQPAVQKLLEEKSRGAYAALIEQLQPGTALKIHPSEWTGRKESLQHFFLSRFNKGGERKVSVRRLNDNCYYVIKL